MIGLVRVQDAQQGVRVGVNSDGAVSDVTDAIGSLTGWLQASTGRVDAAIADLRVAAAAAPMRWSYDGLISGTLPGVRLLPPLEVQDVWASGVTYDRSRAARQEEAVDGGDVYARVYAAERPELFFKARGPWVVGPGDVVGIRADATWNVPEPELTLIINPALEVVGMTAGNDMSSRDIEGANPLYLPQAKVYTASCALGPQIVLGGFDTWPQVEISVTIHRQEQTAFSGTVHTSRIKRGVGELIKYLGRGLTFPDGVLLMTGTGIIPPNEFTLAAGDVVDVSIEGIGVLTNTVKVV
jgi:2-dehydro-3-deoxy-D-arabinonate dehydratase